MADKLTPDETKRLNELHRAPNPNTSDKSEMAALEAREDRALAMPISAGSGIPVGDERRTVSRDPHNPVDDKASRVLSEEDSDRLAELRAKPGRPVQERTEDEEKELAALVKLEAREIRRLRALDEERLAVLRPARVMTIDEEDEARRIEASLARPAPPVVGR